jgi:hypothetical protein
MVFDARARMAERAIHLGASALSEVIQRVREQLDLVATLRAN